MFARRKSETYESVVRRSLADEIDTTDRNLTSRVAELMGSHTAARRYRELLDRVLGLELGVVFEGEGQTPGQQVTLDHAIALSRMGEGVSSVAALLTHLASPGRRLFLVEEPENDLHPTALRNLLLIFREAADEGHQFLVTTHSDIVLRELGAKTDSRIYRVERAQADSDAPPVSSFHLLDDSLDREAALLDLGYEQTAPYGWLLLEEASGETFVRDVLIPLFVPRLSILRTVSSRGTGNLSARLEGLHSMLLFAHLSSDTQRAWVLADGDHAGREAVEKLRDGFNTWPESRFQTLPEDDIEDFYPAEFAEDVSAIRGEGDPRRASRRKGKLAQDVRDWALKNPVAARTALGQSAAALIEVLEDVERQLGAS